jgi:hypothetical protein
VTPTTALQLEFADGEYLFDLKLPQLLELQEKCGNVGALRIRARVLAGRYLFDGSTVGVPAEGEAFVEDLFETIRLGLIGGGRGLVNGVEVAVNSMTAIKLVERYCHPAPLREAWTLAAAILAARFEGYTPPEPAKKKARGKPVTRKGGSNRRTSSKTAASSEPIGES